MSHDLSYFSEQPPKRRHRRAIILSIAVALTVLATGLAAIVGVRSFAIARNVKDDLSTAQTALAGRDFEKAVVAISRAGDNVDRLQSQMKFVAILKPIPWVGKQARLLGELIDGAEESIDIVQELVSLGREVEMSLQAVDALQTFAGLAPWRDLDPRVRLQIATSISRVAPSLEEAHVRLGEQRRRLEEENAREYVAGLRQLRNELYKEIVFLDETLELVVPILQVLPKIGGFEQTQHYLVLLQNTGELRPTGGFWGTYGVLTVDNGEITSIETDDIYAVDFPAEGFVNVEPPAPIKKYLGVDKWWLRDANWSPDVPTAVRQGLAFFEAETSVPSRPDRPVTAPDVEFDGAVLVTPAMASRLLHIFGSITLQGVEFTPENLIHVLEYEVEQAFRGKNIPSRDRKEIIEDMIDVLLVRMEQADQETYGQFIHQTLDGLDEQDLIFYSTNPDVQRVVERKGWAGDLVISSRNDHFMVVDANLAALKTDVHMRRSYSYTVDRDIVGDLIATLRIDYDHIGGFDYRTTRYRTYTRVYVPLGSELISVEGALQDDALKNPAGTPGTIDVDQDFGATVFGAFTSIEPGESGVLSFTYKLPERIRTLLDEGVYRLDVQRQPGLLRIPLSVDLDFDQRISYADPAEVSEYWYDDTYTITTVTRPYQRFDIRLDSARLEESSLFE